MSRAALPALLLLAGLLTGCTARGPVEADPSAVAASVSSAVSSAMSSGAARSSPEFPTPTPPSYAAARGAAPSGDVATPGLDGRYAVAFPAVYTVRYGEAGGATSSTTYAFGAVRRWDPADASIGDLRRCDVSQGSALVPLVIEQRATGGPAQHVPSRLAEPPGDARLLAPDQQLGWAAFFGDRQGARCSVWGDGVPGDDDGSTLTTRSQQLLAVGTSSALVGYLVIPYYYDDAHPGGHPGVLAALSAAAPTWTGTDGVAVTVTGCAGPGAALQARGIGGRPGCLLPFGSAVG